MGKIPVATHRYCHNVRKKPLDGLHPNQCDQQFSTPQIGSRWSTNFFRYFTGEGNECHQSMFHPLGFIGATYRYLELDDFSGFLWTRPWPPFSVAGVAECETHATPFCAESFCNREQKVETGGSRLDDPIVASIRSPQKIVASMKQSPNSHEDIALAFPNQPRAAVGEMVTKAKPTWNVSGYRGEDIGVISQALDY